MLGTYSEVAHTPDLQNIRPREALRLGAARGLEAWAAYAAAECLFSSVLPLILPRLGGDYVTNDAFTAFITVFYVALGALYGAASGALLRLAGRRLPWLGRVSAHRLLGVVATLSVAAAVELNFYQVARLPFPLTLGAIWITLIAGGATSGAWARRLAPLTNPWTTSVVLLGSEWLNAETLLDWTPARSALLFAAYILAVLLAAVGLWKLGRRRPLRWMAGASLVALGAAFSVDQTVSTAAAGPSAPPPQGRPNVILITLDTVRADHLSLYGYARRTTPHLERFAQEAAVYTNAVAAGDLTLSSHASLFTGLYPSSHGAHTSAERYWGAPLPVELPSLPVILSGHGYRTQAVVANFAYLAQAFGFSRGFERYDPRMAAPFLAQGRAMYLRSRVRNYLTHFVPPAMFERQARSAEDINRAVFAVLDELKRGSRPFFLFINYMDAHWPYLPPPPYDMLYPGKAKRFTGPKYFSLREDLITFQREMTPAERDHLVSQYDGALNYLDAQLAELIARLKQNGLYDNTLLVITADHGEAFGEHHMLSHGVSVYQDQVHIPLLIKFPSGRSPVPAATRIDAPVSQVDILPTILATLHYAAPPRIQGRSLLDSDPKPSRTVFAESFPVMDLSQLHPAMKRIERAAYSGSLKLISSTVGKRELYDLAKDPAESTNQYAGLAVEARPLETELAGLARRADARPASTQRVDHGTVDKLRSLGYVQ